MKAPAYAVIVFVLAAGLVVNASPERAFAQTTEQPTAPQKPAADREPVATQATIVRSGPEPAPAVAPFDAEQAKRHQEAWAAHLGIPVELTNSIGMKLVLIPPGEFMMGSADSEADRRGDEGPQHQVRITKPFYMGIHEVTQEQYERVMGENPSYIKGPQQPVEWLNWEKTARFCDVLSALPTEKALGRTYGLPTEAQWEYACRAGTAERYNFGDEVSKLGEYAWSSEKPLSEFKVPCVTGRAHPVGQKRASAWGLYDMHGNVQEWCAGLVWRVLLREFAGGRSTRTCYRFRRVFRDGAWEYAAAVCRSACRSTTTPTTGIYNLGFRIALVLPVSPDQPSVATPSNG